MAAISWRALAGDVVTRRFCSASKSSRPLVLTTSSPSNMTAVGQLGDCGCGNVAEPVGEVVALPRPDPRSAAAADHDRPAS
jgi:hypothetical protein